MGPPVLMRGSVGVGPDGGESVSGSTCSGVALGVGACVAVSAVVAVGKFAETGTFPVQPVIRLMINTLMKKCFRLSIGLADYTSL